MWGPEQLLWTCFKSRTVHPVPSDMHRTKRHKMQKPAQRILGSNQCLVAPAEFESAWQYQTLSHKFPIMLNKFCAGGSQRILKQRLSSTVTVSMALCGVCGVCGVCSLWSVVLLLALLWHMCLTMARPHQTERRKLEASNVAVTLGFGNIKVCQFCQPPRFCRLHWMALPNRHPTHQPPVISPSSAPMALCPHGSLPRTVSPSTSGLDVTRAVIASARPWATSPRQPKHIRLHWQGTFTRFGLFCIALLYFGNGSQLFKTVSLYLWWSPSIFFTTKSDWHVQYQVDCARQRSGRQLQGVRRHSAGLVGEWLPSGKIVLWG